MVRVLIVILVIVAIGYVWYQWQARNASAREQTARAQVGSRAETVRSVPPIAADAIAASAPDSPAADVSERSSGLLQDAADAAAGIALEKQTEEMEHLTAGLAAARREADAAAARLAAAADDALLEVRASGQADVVGDMDAEEVVSVGNDADSAPPGAIRGDGGAICPPVYPIKGNARSMLFHVPAHPNYARTIPELCFTTVDSAIAAGYREARH